ncbi:primosomal protein N' (replication factor Y) [Bacillus tianshenii]|uniref:Replication restart protein PriA n=1 Tax=Sutcliffiella tianshenii TaxID=1463404 RepID=A0ABS2NWB5_9BACI|nr:primosomal protein N' [Bacillus tianshenii]MBM7618936.1 primosomal protein N' (replication factor Y) [Bacillus tianshenii]
MTYASVIVDVPAKQTDRVFDYEIPDKWEGFIQPGMRVVVPFGPRQIQGFVVGLKETTSVKKTRPISNLIDISPILTQELLQLAQWLRDHTLCFTISAFQAMLPAALKAKYEKWIIVRDRRKLPPHLELFFDSSDRTRFEDFEGTGHYRLIKQLIDDEILEVYYEVKDKLSKKTVKVIVLSATKDELKEAKKNISARAQAQHCLIDFFLETGKKRIEKKQLLEELQIGTSAIGALVKLDILQEVDDERYRDPYAHREFAKSEPLALTSQQQEAISPILSSIENEKHEGYVMFGVTGSGKTEVYMQAVDAVLKKGKEAIVLVPEISLTPQMVNRFKSRFGSDVAVMHSGLGMGEKYDEWRKIHRKEVKVVVGARSAIFAPFENVGIIIIDEEHETSYKQEDTPRYHARDIAMERGRFHRCPVVLGSATPTLETFARASKGVYHLLTMDKRMSDQGMPTVEIVDMREELREGNRSMFSRDLLEKLQIRLERGEQSVLFLNKRGYSSFVMCRDCGYVVECPHCDISLTYHRISNMLKCHYCGYEEQVHASCPSCDSDHFRFFGTGTQKVEEELTKLLPSARVIRMDVDTTSKKGSHEKLLQQFGDRKADILLGTQMIAKGLDFPQVTLVGVLTADTMLNIPDFRSSEKTFQLLTQVSGRAGRHVLPGEVVIQTYSPEHYSVELASTHDYLGFYQKEMLLRKSHQYPPFYYLALVTVTHQELTKVVTVTERITSYLSGQLSKEAVILGPVSSPIARIKDRYRYQCIIKYKREPNLHQALKNVVEKYQSQMDQEKLAIHIDLNPYMLM